MDGDSRYDILSNVTYQQEFQWISYEQRNQGFDHELSDMILRALNLDEDKKANKSGGEMESIFCSSYGLLKAQALGDKEAKKHTAHSPRGQAIEEGGESDNFHRF